MVQTRYMKKNNITFEENEAREYHVKLYNEYNKSCPSSWATLVNTDAKKNINYIFNLIFNLISARSSQGWLDVIRRENLEPDSPDVSTDLVIFLYERQRDRIKREVAKDCQHCSETW